MIYLMDVGHSYVKLAKYDIERQEIDSVDKIIVDSMWYEKLRAKLRLAQKVVFCSVNKEIDDLIEKLLSDVENERVTVDKVPMVTDYDTSRLGIDRLLDCYAAWQIYKRNLVVIDAGTMLTVDWVEGARHLGGVILPGLGLLCGYFNNHFSIDSSRLFEEQVVGLPCNTEQAILHGMKKMYEFIAEIKQPVVVTGGDARCFMKLFGDKKESLFCEDNLVVKGLKFYIENINPS